MRSERDEALKRKRHILRCGNHGYIGWNNPATGQQFKGLRPTRRPQKGRHNEKCQNDNLRKLVSLEGFTQNG